MDSVSHYMNSSLKGTYNAFLQKAGNGNIGGGIETICAELAKENEKQQINKHNILETIGQHFGISRDDAAFFMQECGRVISEKYTDNADIKTKQKILQTLKDTDLTAEVKNSLCLSVAHEAIANKDIPLLDLSCIQSDGIGISDFSEMQGQITETFGTDKADKIEMALKMKNNPQRTAGELTEKLHNGEINTAEYVMQITLASSVDTGTESVFDVNTSLIEEQNDQFAFNLKIDGNEEKVCIGEQKKDELSIKPDDAIKIIQKYQIRSDTILDTICEVDIPPEHPNFVSELAQKFANYISAQQLPPGDTVKEQHKLASLLNEDMRATFDNRVDDCMKEHLDERQEQNKWQLDEQQEQYEKQEHEERNDDETYYDDEEQEEFEGEPEIS